MLEVLRVSSLEKILPEAECSAPDFGELTVLKGERASFQLAYKAGKYGTDCGYFKHKFTVTHTDGMNITVYDVMNVPIGLATNPESFSDPNYITHSSCMIPDWLTENTVGYIYGTENYKSLWFEIEGIDKAGEYTVTVDFTRIDRLSPYIECEEIDTSVTFTLNVLPAAIPEQKLIFTQWFHTDCISSYYGVEAFSERHWELIESFMRMAHRGGINLIYTPIFTPPLDTAIGGERPTAQLTDISYIGGKYSFDFSKLHRFIRLAKEIGIKYFEMAHLFTQWGAKFTPKIMVQTEDGLIRKFGWDVAATDSSYIEFLDAFLPALIGEIKKAGIIDNTYFHISDEPNEDNWETYLKAKEIADKHLKGYNVIDAASHYDIYLKAGFAEPIVSTNCIKPYIDNKVPNLWAYYCCCESTGRSNRLMAMPSYRTRFLAYQLFKYNIKGFLHWGYNFYYSQYSTKINNPFVETDGSGAFPSGDCYSVYPTPRGAEPSLRFIVFQECLQDLRAMELLAEFIGRERVIEMIEEICGEEIIFEHCAENAATIFAIREKINSEIMKYVK